MEFCKTLALTLNRIDYSNTSQIATFYTLHYGKLLAMARGSKRMGKKALGSIDLFSCNEIIFLKKDTADLYLLTEWETREDFPAFRKDIEKFYSACYIVELVDRLSEQGEPDRILFYLILNTLHGLSRCKNNDLHVLAFEFQLLKHLGYLPDLGECIQCRQRFPKNSEAVFSPSPGGLLCRDCTTGGEGFSLSPLAMGVANFLVNCQLTGLERLYVSQTVCNELRRLTEEYLAQVLAKPIAQWR